MRTECDPIPEATEPLLRASIERVALLVEPPSSNRRPPVKWRCVVPLSVSDVRGAALIDFVGDPPRAEHIVRLADAFRPRLEASLAVHAADGATASAGALLEAAGALSGIVDPDAVAAELLDRALRLTEAHTGSVLLTEPCDAELRIAASRGLPESIADHTRVRSGDGVAGWVYATGTSAVIEDRPGRADRGRRHGVRSALSVPIADEQGVLGVLNVGWRTYPAYRLGPARHALEQLGCLGAGVLRTARETASARSMYFDSLQALVMALETKDPFAHGTTDRIVDITATLGRALDLSPDETEALRIASLLHDIGMSAAGDALTVSNRPLSTVEHTLLKMHPVIAADILRHTPALERVVPIVYHHHEHYDGSGYLAGVSGERIPLGARILAVADAFVAMTSDRPYRRALSNTDALCELTRHAGTQFDPSVVEAFAEVCTHIHERPPLGAAAE